MGPWHVLREPAVPMLLAATVVHVVRRDLSDILLFAGTAVVIIIDAARSHPPAGQRVEVRPRRWVGVVIALYAAGVALAPVSSVGARFAVIATGLVAVIMLWTARGPGDLPNPGRSPRGWLTWATVGVIACLWELTSFIWGQIRPDAAVDHPAVSDLVEPLLQSWLGRAIFVGLWAAAGWWLLRLIHTGVDSRGPDERAGRPEPAKDRRCAG